MIRLGIFGTCLICFCYCTTSDHNSEESIMDIQRSESHYTLQLPVKDSLYNKILGALVGSAIGDAMGAPTEMWSRDDRQVQYGYMQDLEPGAINPSPEGLWDFQLPAGATTDDTRWKLLIGRFLSLNIAEFYAESGPDPYHFAEYILQSYRDEVTRVKETEGIDPKNLENNIRRMAWLQEWALVADPFVKKDLEGYTMALHKFYGGELLCAGMLYAPVMGLPYPGKPDDAYRAAYRLGIFDQGYARDITGLTSAMVAAALSPQANSKSILEVFQKVDPHEYFHSRLFGRIAYRTYQQALRITARAKQLKECPESLRLALVENDSLSTCQLQAAFSLLDQNNQHAPAHAQEILLVSLTAMVYSDFNFEHCMEFITNYGRDNDTSGAVAGAVLGALHGFNKLPSHLREQVLNTNKKHMGIDLETVANDISEAIINQAPGSSISG